MKFNIFIDENEDEKIDIFAHSQYPWIEELRKIVQADNNWVLGYKEEEILKLSLSDIYCFTIENSKLYVYTKDSKFLIKERLYQIEEFLNSNFMKVNQSTIVNINQIEKFTVSFGGTLKVVLKNSFSDYVSRRQIRAVKERMGIK